MRVAIVGSRDFPDLFSVRRFVQELEKYFGRDVVVVSGGARGVDRAAENEARRLGLGIDIYLADWDTHGRKAGFVRNELIVDAADYVVAFWDGVSRGTDHTIALARKAGKPVHIVRRAAA